MREFIPKILIIDDISENLITLQMNLRSLNVEIISAQSGKEALIQVKQHDFAVMIIDIQMPEINGFQTAERIRQGRRNRHTPIIFLTAVFHDQNSIYQGYRSGAVDYITKPFNREILLSKVKVFLDLDRIKTELSDSKQQFQSIVQDQTDLICRTEKDLKISFANRALLVAFAKTFESLKGKSILNWVEDEDLQKVTNAIKVLTPTNAVVKINHKLSFSRTRQIDVSTIIRALFDTDFELTGFQMVMRDITSEVTSKKNLATAREEILQASKSRTQFVANMSHEIRTPMNSIVGLLDVLADSNLDEDQRETLGIIKHSAGNLLSLLNDIIDLSKIDSNQIDLVSNWFNPVEMLNKTIRLLEVKAQENNNKLILELDDDLPEKVKGDQLRIEQILINLLNNALKFTSDGTVKLNVKKVSEDAQKTKVRFMVSDTGMGMDEDVQKSIFNIYDQGKDDVARKFGGSGLGLAISQSLCNKMGGKIELDSKPGEGTSFWFTLTMEAKVKEKEPNNKGIHILVVEDNLLNQRVVGTTLKRNGFTYDVAENGKVAVEKFKSGKFNLVIMDIQMPVMDGYEATQLIRGFEKENPGRKKTSIIALTANATKEDQEKCLEVGMDDYMTKPFRFKELTTIIEKLAV
jgi:PAS domain S-box-containing protein